MFISACLVETACKLHAPGTDGHGAALRVAGDPLVKALRDNPVFQAHRRCEPNYGLDSGALACLEMALPLDDVARAAQVLAALQPAIRQSVQSVVSNRGFETGVDTILT